MAISRQVFNISTDTGGDFTDSGPAFFGIVTQARLAATGLDTGCDIELTLSGSGVVVGKWDNVGGSTFTKSPRQQYHDTGGVALGANEYIYSAGDHLKLVVEQSAGVTGSKTGTFYVWTLND